jgi:hypothetical protein
MMLNSDKEKIRQQINRLCKLLPGRPTDSELSKILSRYSQLPTHERDEDALVKIVTEEAPQDGFYLTEGLDTSDVDGLLDQLNSLLGN